MRFSAGAVSVDVVVVVAADCTFDQFVSGLCLCVDVMVNVDEDGGECNKVVEVGDDELLGWLMLWRLWTALLAAVLLGRCRCRLVQVQAGRGTHINAEG